MIMDDYPHIKAANELTTRNLKVLRKEIAECLEFSDYKNAITLVTTGSYGRGEATAESDLDWFIVFDRDLPAEEVIGKEIKAITQVVDRHIVN